MEQKTVPRFVSLFNEEERLGGWFLKKNLCLVLRFAEAI